MFAPDLVWRIEGHSLTSKEYRSRQQFIDEVLAPFEARFSRGEPFRPTTIRSITAEGDTVVVWDGPRRRQRRPAVHQQLRLDHAARQRQGH